MAYALHQVAKAWIAPPNHALERTKKDLVLACAARAGHVGAGRALKGWAAAAQGER
jgi:hypothetical protein